MNGMAIEIDPLGAYEYTTYDSYGNVTTPYAYDKQNLKVEVPVSYNFTQNYNTVLPSNAAHIQNDVLIVPDTNIEKHIEIPVVNNSIDTSNNNLDAVDVKPIILDGAVKKEKLKGKRSSYWSVKITDKDFPFYGCSVCNVSFITLQELDQHVTAHKDRITSYDLRVQNQIKRKRLKKEKKLNKIKLEKQEVDIEIKPEDGYIGTEKASEFNENSLVNNEDNTNNNKNEVENNSIEKKEKSKGNDVSTNKEEEGKNKDLQKIYKCFACQKQFTLSYYLRLHVRSHTDEKPYICSICGQSFITASKLGRHNKRIHLAIRYQCRICFKFFSQFDLLTRHFDKKHIEDKLEGEPYDYNAILPYLKELEEQLKQKTEAEKKPKIEELWPDKWVEEEQFIDPNIPPSKPDQEQHTDDSKELLSVFKQSPDIIVEDANIRPHDEVKRELEDDDLMRNDHEDQLDYNNDSFSDEDYFPSNTWARVSPPRLEPGTPPSPRRARRPRGEGPITCEVCQKTISSVTYLRIHMRTHTGEKPFKCYVCNRGFITSSKMHRHVLTHSETWDETNVKREQMKCEGEVNAEVVAEEENNGIKVKKSKSKFHKKRQKLGPEKQKKRYQKRPHACDFCQKRFLHLETLQVHKKSHEGELLILKCNYCFEEMPDETARRDHEASHTGPKPYLCTLCGKCYKKRETLVYHRKHHKPDKRDFICDICSKRFNSPGKLQRHLVSHRVDKFVLRYECPVCAHMFNTIYHVQMHLATHQKEGLIVEENRNEILAMVLQNARKFPKQPDAPSNLTDMIPSDERSRICNICGEIFQHFYYLEEHLKGHGSRIAIEDLNKPEEKKYTCQVCEKSFKLHYYLKLHSFTHTKEKPFICQQCGKGFITKGKLKRHLETHTGLKKYQCHVCYKFFTRPSYLRIHVRTIHGTQDYNFRLDRGYGSFGALSVMTQLSQGSV